MSFLSVNGKFLTSEGKFIGKFVSLPSEGPAISRMQSFITAINAEIVDNDRLPIDQAELSSYMSFAPADNYTFDYTTVDSSMGYFNATSESPLVHSFTRTVAWNLGSLTDIICSKIGTVPPGPADYIGGILSCQIGTDQNP